MDDRAVGAAGSDLASGRAGPPRRAHGSPRVGRVAFAVSLAFHVVAVMAYPFLVRTFEPEGFALRFATPAFSPGGIEVVNLVEVDAPAEVERPDDPREIEEVTAEAEVTGPNLEERIAFELPPRGLTPAERLRPGFTDARLWAPLPPAFRELSLSQREELLIAGRLGAWYDSVSAVAAAQAAWTDWTFTDGSGGRWGLSPDGLHLGDITIPLPTFEAAPGQQREYMWQWNEIARQSAQAAVQETVRERLEAIRARRDRERAAQQQADSTQAPPPR